MDTTIEQVNSKALGSNYTRSAIKDKAADMVVGIAGSANIAASNATPKVTDYKISDFYNKCPKSNIKVNISFGDNTPAYNVPNYKDIEVNYDIGLLKINS